MRDGEFRATVAQICAGQQEKGNPPPEFFAEYIGKEGAGSYGAKCYGIRKVSNAEAAQKPDRYVGAYGAEEVTFTEPFELQRGHKIVVVKASKERPLICTEHIYPEI